MVSKAAYSVVAQRLSLSSWILHGRHQSAASIRSRRLGERDRVVTHLQALGHESASKRILPVSQPAGKSVAVLIRRLVLEFGDAEEKFWVCRRALPWRGSQQVSLCPSASVSAELCLTVLARLPLMVTTVAACVYVLVRALQVPSLLHVKEA